MCIVSSYMKKSDVSRRHRHNAAMSSQPTILSVTVQHPGGPTVFACGRPLMSPGATVHMFANENDMRDAFIAFVQKYEQMQ